MTSDMETLEDLSREYRNSIPADLRETRTFDWYLTEVYEDPRIARNAHQRVADMFDYYGTEYDEDLGVVEYRLASEDPLNEGENTFYGRNIHESIHESGSRRRRRPESDEPGPPRLAPAAPARAGDRGSQREP